MISRGSAFLNKLFSIHRSKSNYRTLNITILICTFFYCTPLYAVFAENDIVTFVQRYCAEKNTIFPKAAALLKYNKHVHNEYKTIEEKGMSVKLYFRKNQPGFIASILVDKQSHPNEFSFFLYRTIGDLKLKFPALEIEHDGSLTLPTMDAESIQFLHENSVVTKVKIICAFSDQ